ncbi:MAG: hypothetical protein WKG07_29185 [Hymenobacter sp.]
MVDSLNIFAGEVTRVAREVGTEGILGGQANVPNVSGTWKDLTDNVNTMASNLTSQMRDIANVATAVAKGDLSAENHGERARRAVAAQGKPQRNGGLAQHLRRRSNPGGPRSRYRGQARRPGQRAQRAGNVEGFDGQREHDGLEPDFAGAATSPTWPPPYRAAT